jgi:hypothetical protein
VIWNLKRTAQKKIIKEIIDFDYQNEVGILKKRYYYKYTIISGFIGALAILVYYVSLDTFSDFFLVGTFKVSLFENNLEIKPLPIIFNLICLITELYLLGLVNIQMVTELSTILKFKYDKSHNLEIHRDELIKISLENFGSKEKEIGIDPYVELSKTYVYLLLILNRAKAFLSNLIIKIVVRKLVGRYVIRIYTDLLGMPIYFFWNAFACRKVFKRTIFYFYAQNLIDLIIVNMYKKYGKNEDIKSVLYELLATVAVNKRELSSTHYLFSYKLFKQFDVPIIQKYELKRDFDISLKKLPSHLAEDLLLLFITGMIIDGSINKQERKEIERLKSLLSFDSQILKKYDEYLNYYINGQGEDFLEKNNFINDRFKSYL